MSDNLPRKWLFALLLFAVGIGPSHADVFGDLEVHGFATQGLIRTSHNNYFGSSDDGSSGFSELAINVAFHPVSDVRLAGQLLYRKAGSIAEGRTDIDFALADLTIASNERWSTALLAGRLKNPLGLYNETRDIAFARPSVFVPQVIYYEKVRDLILSADGIGLEWEIFSDAKNASIYIAMGEPRFDENVEYGFLNTAFKGDLDPDGFSFIGRLMVETPDKFLRTAFSLAQVSMNFNRSPYDPLQDGEISLWYGIASIQMNGERWAFTAEYMREPVQWGGFSGSIFEDLELTGEGFYAQISYMIEPSVELMFRYGEIYADRDDRSGESFDNRTFGSIPSHTRYSKIFTTGVRWDVSENLMLRAEYQRHNGTFILSSRENPEPGDLDPDWDLFAVEASYRF